MSQRILESHYRPNWRLAQETRFEAFNCGYLRSAQDTFAIHQKNLVWQLIGDTPITSDTTVLDVGCGIGGPIGWVSRERRPGRAIGMDYCGENVRNAHRLWSANGGDAPRFMQADAHCLPVASASVDVLVNLESALHYRDKPAFLRECRRVLKPTGFLCLGDITSRHTRLLNWLGNAARAYVFLFSTEHYRRAFADAGFQLLRHEDASLPVSRSLDAGLAEARSLPMTRRIALASRLSFLRILQRALKSGHLQYDLFAARPV